MVRIVHEGDKSILHVKLPSIFVDRVYFHGTHTHAVGERRDSMQRVDQQHATKSLALIPLAHSQSTDKHDGHVNRWNPLA